MRGDPRRAEHWLRYGAVGCANAALSNIGLIAADRAGFGSIAAVACSFALAVPAAYLLHCRVTYAQAPEWTAFARFAGGAAAGVPLAIATVWTLHDGIGLDMTLAAPLATAIMLCWTYATTRFAILARR